MERLGTDSAPDVAADGAIAPHKGAHRRAAILRDVPVNQHAASAISVGGHNVSDECCVVGACLRAVSTVEHVVKTGNLVAQGVGA